MAAASTLESRRVRNLSTCSSASLFSRSVRSSTVMRRCTSSCTLDVTGVARPLDNRYINEWLLGVRERHGQRILSKHGAVEEVTRLLSDRGTVGFIADQNADPGIWRVPAVM